VCILKEQIKVVCKDPNMPNYESGFKGQNLILPCGRLNLKIHGAGKGLVGEIVGQYKQCTM
jgi:hypothetical protein